MSSNLPSTGVKLGRAPAALGDDKHVKQVFRLSFKDADLIGELLKSNAPIKLSTGKNKVRRHGRADALESLANDASFLPLDFILWKAHLSPHAIVRHVVSVRGVPEGWEEFQVRWSGYALVHCCRQVSPFRRGCRSARCSVFCPQAAEAG